MSLELIEPPNFRVRPRMLSWLIPASIGRSSSSRLAAIR
jgi:hypothetical protein